MSGMHCGTWWFRSVKVKGENERGLLTFERLIKRAPENVQERSVVQIRTYMYTKPEIISQRPMAVASLSIQSAVLVQWL
jgi:hypothetical protein